MNEARDLGGDGNYNRFDFYEHMKAYTAAPPDTLRVDEKNTREYDILNVCGVIITTNHKTDGIYLPEDDRRHYVAWSDREKDDKHFQGGYWKRLWSWYEAGGLGHVIAFLQQRDLSHFDPKAPPPKTPAWWAIVDSNRPAEEAELADAIDNLGNRDVITIPMLVDVTKSTDLAEWLKDRKNRRQIPYRLEKCSYVPVRNPTAKDGQWKVGPARQTIYAKAALPLREQLQAVATYLRTVPGSKGATP